MITCQTSTQAEHLTYIIKTGDPRGKALMLWGTRVGGWGWEGLWAQGSQVWPDRVMFGHEHGLDQERWILQSHGCMTCPLLTFPTSPSWRRSVIYADSGLCSVSRDNQWIQSVAKSRTRLPYSSYPLPLHTNDCSAHTLSHFNIINDTAGEGKGLPDPQRMIL